MQAIKKPTIDIIFLLVTLGITLRVLLAATTFGTNDLFTFMDFAAATAKFGVFNVYKVIPYAYNHPPITALSLNLIGHLTNPDHLHSIVRLIIDGKTEPSLLPWVYFPYTFGLRLIPIAADCISIFLAYKIGGKWPAIAVALSPTLILTSGFHGNTDCIVGMGILLSLYLAQKNHSFLAGIATGVTGGLNSQDS